MQQIAERKPDAGDLIRIGIGDACGGLCTAGRVIKLIGQYVLTDMERQADCRAGREL